jgi:hypothetical protein
MGAETNATGCRTATRIRFEISPANRRLSERCCAGEWSDHEIVESQAKRPAQQCDEAAVARAHSVPVNSQDCC